MTQPTQTAPTKISTDPIVKKLADHLQEIFNDVSSLAENKYVFLRFREIMQPNIGITDNVFFDHYVVNYVNSASAAVRRQVDTKASRGGLRILLGDISKSIALITKEDYMRPFGIGLTFEGERIWSERYGGKDTLDPAIVQADITLLESTAKPIKDMVDKRVAHRDKDAHLYNAQYNDLHNAIDLLEKLTIKYYTLIASTGSGIDSLLAGNIAGWESIFKEPWVS